MTLEPAMEGASAPHVAEPVDDRARETRRLRRLDLAAGLVALVGTGAFLANMLVLQPPPPGAPLPAARPAGAGQSAAKTNRTTVPLSPPATPATAVPSGGATTGSLGYLSIRTTVTGTAAPLVPATAAPARTVADARGEPPPRRPPASIGPASDVTGAVRPPADLVVSPRILSVQKALAKLGYGPLKVDGRPGGETRSAVQRFQHDRNLAADGEISDRLVRELASVSGMALN